MHLLTRVYVILVQSRDLQPIRLGIVSIYFQTVHS